MNVPDKEEYPLPGDTQRSRGKQNLAALAGIAFAVMIAITPWAIASGIEAKNDGASAHQTKTHLTMTATEVGDAKLVFYNRTGDVQKVDIKAQLVDVPNANGAGFAGVEIATALSQTGSNGTTTTNTVHQRNNTDWTRESYVELTLANASAQNFLQNSVTGLQYTFRALSSGQYLKDHQDTVNATNYHKASDKDFRVEVRFVYGNEVLLKSAQMDIQTGSKVGDNYTGAVKMDLFTLADARLDGLDATELSPQKNNQVVVRVYGYRNGNNGLASDDVILSVKFVKPDTPGVVSYEDGAAVGMSIAGVILAIGGVLASPYVALKDIDRLDRKYGRMR